MFFKNCNEVQLLFNDILEHIITHINENKKMPSSIDQPFIIYHAYKNKIYDNILITKFVSMWENKTVEEYISNENNYINKKLVHFIGTRYWWI